MFPKRSDNTVLNCGVDGFNCFGLGHTVSFVFQEQNNSVCRRFAKRQPFWSAKTPQDGYRDLTPA